MLAKQKRDGFSNKELGELYDMKESEVQNCWICATMLTNICEHEARPTSGRSCLNRNSPSRNSFRPGKKFLALAVRKYLSKPLIR